MINQRRRRCDYKRDGAIQHRAMYNLVAENSDSHHRAFVCKLLVPSVNMAFINMYNPFCFVTKCVR
ncbi:hypothetical protein GCM10007086_21890 [Photobacterium aphoticum]|nr:hypothetical protein GCM10007086_21890 [Photobacterium aphoticum]